MGGVATDLGRARSGPRDQGPAEPSRSRRGPRGTGQGRLAALLLSPTLLVLGVVILFPIVAAVWDSLHTTAEGLDADGLIVEGERFSGADNYTDLFRGETGERFRTALWNTTFFTVVTVAIETVVGLAMALLMHRAFRGRALFRASVLVPWAIPTAISALLWRWIFAADGVANAVLGREVLWTADAVQAKIAVIVADTWKTAPFVALLVLAGLQIIPREVYEAARVDGASRWRQLVHITLPLVKPALLVAVMFRMMDALRMFDLPQVLIGARKPSVETLSQVAWDEAMNLRYGPAAAVATALFLYIALAAYAFVRLLGADLIGDRKGAS
ncbi:MAG TPA: sugar ABC transporter permease [Thermomonospora sp.]|nr:sugar ABC transporter permease [Thermomonospora sp.]